MKLKKSVLKQVPVIRKILEQQMAMCSQEDRKCSDRIVSIYQDFIRPIFKGKLAHRNEFGQKLHLMDVSGDTFVLRTGWNNYSEGNEVPDVIRHYYRMYRMIPTSLLADLAYKTGDNKVFCGCLGIRFTGRRRGQTGAAAEEADNAPFAQQDANERSIIEGRNGTAKTRYGLDRILCVLDPAQRGVSSMAVLNMNHNNRTSHRLMEERDMETKVLCGKRRPYRKTARC